LKFCTWNFADRKINYKKKKKKKTEIKKKEKEKDETKEEYLPCHGRYSARL
jgi:hypothetical protein